MLWNFKVRKGKHIVKQAVDASLEQDIQEFRQQMSKDSGGRTLACCADGAAAAKATKVMLAELPNCWDETCLVQDGLNRTCLPC